MPKATNTDNPICQHESQILVKGEIVTVVCGYHTTYNGTLSSGAKQYRCRRHKPNWTCTDSDRPVGGQIKGERKMTQKELTERWKLNDPEGYKKSKQKSRSKKDD